MVILDLIFYFKKNHLKRISKDLLFKKNVRIDIIQRLNTGNYRFASLT